MSKYVIAVKCLRQTGFARKARKFEQRRNLFLYYKVESIKKHQENLKWNLTRLYRIRNEIVHNAAIKNGIYVNIAHMKYYLTFILNSILDFMANTPIDVNNDNRITIEDFFFAQDIMLGSLKSSSIQNFITVKQPRQILH